MHAAGFVHRDIKPEVRTHSLGSFFPSLERIANKVI